VPGLAGVIDPERDGPNAVAVQVDVRGNLGVRTQGRSKHKAHLALLKDVAGAVTATGFGARIGDQRHAEGGAIEVGCLAGIADIKLDMVGPLKRKEICGLRMTLNIGLRCHREALLRGISFAS